MIACVARLSMAAKAKYSGAVFGNCAQTAYQLVLAGVLQTATMSKESNKILPKEYIVKVQSVKSSDIRGKRNTFGKAIINLTEYCTLEPQAGRNVSLQLK